VPASAPSQAHPSPPRDDPATTPCPVCHHPYVPIGRQRYCSPACRKTAFRRRHQDPPAAITVPPQRTRRQYSIYQCPNCDQQLAGEQRCPDCGTFARRAGIGGTCPHCDQPVSLADLLDHEITLLPATRQPARRPTGNPPTHGNPDNHRPALSRTRTAGTARPSRRQQTATDPRSRSATIRAATARATHLSHNVTNKQGEP